MFNRVKNEIFSEKIFHRFSFCWNSLEGKASIPHTLINSSVVLWMTILWLQPHKVNSIDLFSKWREFSSSNFLIANLKEDRFIFPINPLILLSASIFLHQIEVKKPEQNDGKCFRPVPITSDEFFSFKSIFKLWSSTFEIVSIENDFICCYSLWMFIIVSNLFDNRRLFRSHSFICSFEYNKSFKRIFKWKNENLCWKRLVSFSVPFSFASKVKRKFCRNKEENFFLSFFLLV